MKKLKALIVDDEIHVVEGLAELVKTYCPEVEVVGKAFAIKEAMDLTVSENPDIIFLDVHLPGGNGFDLVEIARTRHCTIIFVSGHRDYAAQAYRVDAIDYLLKPVDFKELQTAVVRAVARKRQENSPATQTEHRIRLNTASRIQFIAARNIVAIHGDGRYSTIYSIDEEEQIVSRNLGEFEAELEPAGFFRVHKSWLINCAHVRQLFHVDGGTIELTNGQKVLLSRRKKLEFLKRMEK